jgi:hypothetical protein
MIRERRRYSSFVERFYTITCVFYSLRAFSQWYRFRAFMLIKDQFRYLRWFIRKSLTNQTIMETDFETRTRPANMATKPKEGPVAKQIEEQTAKIPSDTFLWTAIGAMAVSLSFRWRAKIAWLYLSANGHHLFCSSAFTIN